jgi:RHS repeat-associated protein
LSFWSRQATVGSGRQNVLGSFATSGGFYGLAGTLYREAFWLVSDRLGTPRTIVGKSGTLASVKRHDYLPFGEELYAGMSGRTTTQGYTGDSTRQHFTGYEADGETGLNFAEARYQSNLQGRFTSVDPFGASASVGNPQSFNRYSYVNNNPSNLTDPTGMQAYDASNSYTDAAGSLEPQQFNPNRSHFGGPAILYAAGLLSDISVMGGSSNQKGNNMAGTEGKDAADSRDRLQDAVVGYKGELSPGVDDRFNGGHYGPHALSPENGGKALSLPSLSGTVVYWNYQQISEDGIPELYTVRVRPTGANFYVNYEDLASVTTAITRHMKPGVFNANSGVKLSAWQVFGTVRPWAAGDPQNRSKRGLHIEFVKVEFYEVWARNVGKHGTEGLGASSPTYRFINPCGGSGSPVRCK